MMPDLRQGESYADHVPCATIINAGLSKARWGRVAATIGPIFPGAGAGFVVAIYAMW
jgi:hypothetical protein